MSSARWTAAFNEMQAQQQSYEEDWREARDQLEDRARERTAEPAGARDEAQSARARLDDAIETISEGSPSATRNTV